MCIKHYKLLLVSIIVLSLLGCTSYKAKPQAEIVQPIKESVQKLTLEKATNTWDSKVIYTGGERVTFEGKIFEAKWWTTGEKPDIKDEWGVWKYIDEAKNIEQASANSQDNTKENDTESSEQVEMIEPQKENKVSKTTFKRVGYFPEWKPQKESSIQYDKLTHINYSFAIPTGEGTVRPLEQPELAKKIIQKAHKQGVKVLLAVGGWEYQGTPLEATFIAATETEEKTIKLTNSIMKMVNDYGFDGVDMDWEHPRADGASKNQYARLMKHLNKALKAQNKLLTAAVVAGVTPDGNVLWDAEGHLDMVFDYVDWFNVMAYDGGEGDRHSNYDFAVKSALYWKDTRGMEKSKVVLGVPFYSRPGWLSYEEIVKQDATGAKKDRVSGMYYNGMPTIQKKAEWAKKNVGGIMIWEISQDTTDSKTSLLKVIYDVTIK